MFVTSQTNKRIFTSNFYFSRCEEKQGACKKQFPLKVDKYKLNRWSLIVYEWTIQIYQTWLLPKFHCATFIDFQIIAVFQYWEITCFISVIGDSAPIVFSLKFLSIKFCCIGVLTLIMLVLLHLAVTKIVREKTFVITKLRSELEKVYVDCVIYTTVAWKIIL